MTKKVRFGMVPWIGLPSEIIEYRKARFSGSREVFLIRFRYPGLPKKGVFSVSR